MSKYIFSVFELKQKVISVNVDQIKYDCLPYAENLEMMKEQGIEGTGNQQKSSDDDDLDEPDDISDFSDYEGGKIYHSFLNVIFVFLDYSKSYFDINMGL